MIINMALRIVLLIGSLGILFVIIKRVKKAKIQISDSIFWILLAALLLINVLLPELANICAQMLGFAATSNFIFCLIIGILLIRQFHSAQEVSQLRHKVDVLSQEIGIFNKEYRSGCASNTRVNDNNSNN